MNIQTTRCIIRKFKATDIRDLYHVLSNSEVMKYIEPIYSMKKTKEFIMKYGICDDPKIWAIEYKEINKVIGHLIFHPYDKMSYELGWILNNTYWNKGIATEITKTIICYINENTNLESLVIECDQQNIVTKKIAIKFGFIYEGNEGNCYIYRLKIR